MDNPYTPRNTREMINRPRERWIRYSAILIIGVLMPMIYGDLKLFTPDYFIAILVSVIRTAALWAGSEFLMEKVLGRFDFFKDTAKALIWMTLSLILYTTLVITAEIAVMEYFTSYHYDTRDKLLFYETANLITLLITTLYASTFFFISWRENLLKAEKLEKANLEARYETLKNQVNPHFLFNSLNTLAGMLNENSEEMEYVQNLSNFLRNVLQSGVKEVVTLREELEFTKQYAFIQLRRFHRKLEINFEIDERALDRQLPPLSLQMLIENAIKHNIISNEKPLGIRVFLEQDQLVVENNLQRKNTGITTGLGLENICSRYKFLGSSIPEITESAASFIVKLPLLNITV